MGTNCQNQPEVHAITQALRAVARIGAPALIFKAEAIVGPADLAPYLGVGKHAGKVSDLAYQNSLMVQIWSALAAKDTRLFCAALNRFPAKPPTTVWGTYLRCHDDIGWAIGDEDAASVGLNGYEHRRFLADYYAGLYPMSDARGLVFQENLATGDRRISGTAASLIGIESRPEQRRRGAPRPGHPPAAAGPPPGARVRRAAAALHGRRAGAAQRLRLRRGRRARRRQPLGAPAADALGRRRAPAPAGHGRAPGLARHPARHRGPRGAAQPGRLDRDRDRRPGEPGGAGVPAARARPDHGRGLQPDRGGPVAAALGDPGRQLGLGRADRGDAADRRAAAADRRTRPAGSCSRRDATDRARRRRWPRSGRRWPSSTWTGRRPAPACSPSGCPGPASWSPSAPWRWAGTGSACAPSSPAGPSRTRRRSTAGCWSTTSSCTRWRSPSTGWATST